MKITEKIPIASLLGAKFTLPVTKDLKVKLGLVVVRKFFCLVGNLFTAVRDKNRIFGFKIPKVQVFWGLIFQFQQLEESRCPIIFSVLSLDVLAKTNTSGEFRFTDSFSCRCLALKSPVTEKLFIVAPCKNHVLGAYGCFRTNVCGSLLSQKNIIRFYFLIKGVKLIGSPELIILLFLNP